MKTTLVIMAAGIGSRFGGGIKQLAPVGLNLGTFQISDLTYNTLGGAVGGIIYYLGYWRKRKNRIRNRGQLSEH